MFDAMTLVERDEHLEAARSFFCQRARELADAALLLGGPSAEARVIRCSKRLMTASRFDGGLRRDLVALHRLFSLRDAGDADAALPDLDPASPEVEQICLLTDRLEDLLREIEDGSSSSTWDRPDFLPTDLAA